MIDLLKFRLTSFRLARPGVIGSLVLAFVALGAMSAGLPTAIAQEESAQDNSVAEQSEGQKSEAANPETSAAPKQAPVVEDEREEAAWEYRPYQVLIWIVHDHGARLGPATNQLIDQLYRRSRIADPSGWNVTIQPAPEPWNGRLLSTGNFDRWTEDITLSAKTTAGSRLDKLLIVKLTDRFGMIRARVQELDLKTRLWGAEIDQSGDLGHIGAVVFDGIRNAFMPLTRIDTIHGLDVLARVRGSGIAWVPDTNEDGEMIMVPNVGSPVWIGDHEILLPVILRKDRLGNINEITAVEHTFLTIKGRSGPHLNCDTVAMQRAPLGGRSGGRTERMALCVRAPDQGTTLSLLSNEKEPEPLRDLEVFSRTEEGEASDFIGKSDWQGKIKIPPSEEGIRVLLIKSGRRPLARVPVVPGLYPELSARMPNDERRLYAEGIAKGYQNELFDLLARRLILSTLIEAALARGDLPDAETKLSELRRVEDSKRFNSRLNQEKKGLLAGDERQKGFIDAMFKELEGLSNVHLDAQRVAELSREILDAQKASQ